MKNFWETIKNIFGTAKNLGIAVLVLILIIGAFRGCSIYKQKIRTAAAAEQAEKDKKANEKLSKEQQAKIDALLASVKVKDEANAAIILERDKYKADKEKIQIKYSNFMTLFLQLSQEGKDKELQSLLKRNGIEVQVVAADNYIKIMPLERENLVKFVSNAEKCEEDKLNCEKDKAKCDEQVALLTVNEAGLKEALTTANDKCKTDKDILTGDNNILKKEKKAYKKNAFWSKVGGVAGIILTILVLR
jgi:hypothetical protein